MHKPVLNAKGALTTGTTIPVLGWSVYFETNDRAVMAIIEEAFGRWRALEANPDLISTDSMRVRITVYDGQEDAAEHAQLTYAIPEYDRTVVSSRGSLGIADAKSGDVEAFVTTALVSDREHFRYGVVEALTLALLTRFDRQPFHAAALVRDDAALLLAGPSGVGKSTLAFAASLEGMQVIAEDVVYLQISPRLRVWGMPGWIHLPPDVKSLFPELEGAVPTVLANGDEKIAVETPLYEAALPVVDRAGVCVVTREAQTSRAIRLSPDEAMRELTKRREPGFDVFEATIGECVARLVAGGAWKVNLDGHPRDTVRVLHQLFDELVAAV